MSTISQLPSEHTALLLNAVGEPLTLQKLPLPEVVHGSVLIRNLASLVDSGVKIILSGKFEGFNIPAPLVPGGRAIGRIAAIGPDTTAFSIGQLVYFDPFTRARDDPDQQFLMGGGVYGHLPGAIKLSKDVWHDGAFAEYTRAPLENVFPLNEKRLLGSPAEGGLGYSIADLTVITRHMVAYGGLRAINLLAGETVIVSPATGQYTGASVEVASAMGARVIAVSRNLEKMKKLAETIAEVELFQPIGDVEKDTARLQEFGKIDAMLEMSPVGSKVTTHMRSSLLALREGGRAALMGGIVEDVPVSYLLALSKNLTLKMQYMYEPYIARDLIKLVESGTLKLGKKAGHEVVARFPLSEWEKCLDSAVENKGNGQIVVFEP